MSLRQYDRHLGDRPILKGFMSDSARLPRIIQGGMGVAVSNWKLARAVSQAGHLGVVSGTALDVVLVRRLQDGDPGGHVRRAMESFPMPDVVAYVMKRFFEPDGRKPQEPYRLLPMYKQTVSALRDQVTMLGSFVEVTLAKEGHDGLVGINLLTKIQMPTLPALYGAMMAGVHVVLMGAGIPREIPGALDAMANHEVASIKLDVVGQLSGETSYLSFDPRTRFPDATVSLPRPRFFPIVSAATLALTLARKSNGRVDGFVVEGPTAGGHNAPPRGPMRLNDNGEPIYGERDIVDLSAMRDIGLPFYLAGGSGSPEALDYALSEGAAGVQVGTLFAYSDESGFTTDIKQRVIAGALEQTLHIRTDARASPTGYPFKIVILDPDAPIFKPRERCCDLGYLREAYRRADGRLDYRCSSEPIDTYLKKGGTLEDTVDRQCLCNALVAGIGAPQAREDGFEEPSIITSGDDVVNLGKFLEGRTSYGAADVLAYLTREVAVTV